MRREIFDWSMKEKEKYYKKAEKLIENIEGIEIDREQFGVRGNNQIAIVHIKRVSKKKQAASIKQLKKIKNFREVTNQYKAQFDCIMKGIFFDGYFEMPMDGGM